MIAVHDRVLADPVTYRAAALSMPFRSVDVGHAVFEGIAPCLDPSLSAWFEAMYPQLTAGLTFFRKSPAGQPEPNFIHTDVDMGDVTAILYLNPHPPAEDGTTFWRHRETGQTASDQVLAGEFGKDLSAWEPWRTVPAAFNRCVVFAAPYFHSRAIEANYGDGDEARLIQVLFAKERK